MTQSELELDFDDVLLQPRPSDLRTDETNLSQIIGGGILELSIPVIAAPMAGIVGVEIIKQLSELGGIGILHRFHSDGVDYAKDLVELKGTNFGASVSIGSNGFSLQAALGCGAKIICVDAANGYADAVLDKCQIVSNYIKTHGYKTLVMSGNVVNMRGCINLNDAGVDMIRVGIGSGALCTTRNTTGVGRPQISAIVDSSALTKDKTNYYYTVVADGGIRNSGDAAKAIAAGAHCVMMGSWFAKAYESDNNGKISGMASKEHQMRVYGYVRSVEGISKHVEKIDSLTNLMQEFVYGLRHAMTYTNSKTIDDLRRDTGFYRVTDSAIKKFAP